MEVLCVHTRSGQTMACWIPMNTAKLIHSGIVYGCCSASMAEVSRCHRDHIWLTEAKIFTIWPYAEKVCILVSRCIHLVGGHLFLSQR